MIRSRKQAIQHSTKQLDTHALQAVRGGDTSEASTADTAKNSINNLR